MKYQNCYNCKKKESACFKSIKIKVELEEGSYFPLICLDCKNKEERELKQEEATSKKI